VKDSAIHPDGGTGRHARLKLKLSAFEETLRVELLKFGETFTYFDKYGNPEPSFDENQKRCRDLTGSA